MFKWASKTTGFLAGLALGAGIIVSVQLYSVYDAREACRERVERACLRKCATPLTIEGAACRESCAMQAEALVECE